MEEEGQEEMFDGKGRIHIKVVSSQGPAKTHIDDNISKAWVDCVGQSPEVKIAFLPFLPEAYWS